MRNSTIALGAVALATLSAPAFAQESGSTTAPSDAAAPADAPATIEDEFTITGSAGLTTDYRFRGISQSNERLAVQGGATVTHKSGFYGSFWGSSIDDYVYLDADSELDLIAGYSKTLENGITLDGGILYYIYASANVDNSDFFEPYASVKYAFGPVTAKVGAAYAWKQQALGVGAGREDNLYVYGDLGTAIPNTPISLTGHLGYSRGRSGLTFAQKDYFDWNVGASYTFKNLTFGVSYVDTDFKKNSPYLFFPGLDSGPGRARNGYDIVDATVLGSITFAF